MTKQIISLSETMQDEFDLWKEDFSTPSQ